MRISDWSSDVCSSDLDHDRLDQHLRAAGVELADQFAKLALHIGVGGDDDRIGAFVAGDDGGAAGRDRSEEHTSELQSLMRISYAVFCLKKKNKRNRIGNSAVV